MTLQAEEADPCYLAHLRTDKQASVPELTNRTISIEGTLLITILARVFCNGEVRHAQAEHMADDFTPATGEMYVRVSITSSRRNCVDTTWCLSHLEFTWSPKRCSLVNLSFQCIVYFVHGMAGNGRSPTQDIIDVPAINLYLMSYSFQFLAGL